MDIQTLAIITLLGSFAVMIFLRFPIAYAVGLSSVFCLLVQDKSLMDVCRLMVKGISSFSLMAVPFFITMGVLMGSGGISEKLIALANSCVGWMRGGLAQVNVVASYFFGGISGSASADTASLGSLLIPMMVDEGYDADFSTAVTITSSCEGLLVPPSHNMVIYATTAGGISVTGAPENAVTLVVVPMEGDATVVVKDLPLADRVVMNLPQIAYQFLDVALSKAKKGGVVHLHRIMERATCDAEMESLLDEMRSKGLDCHMGKKYEMKTYSPTASVYVFDIIRD